MKGHMLAMLTSKAVENARLKISMKIKLTLKDENV
jgi:hypothetical protein